MNCHHHFACMLIALMLVVFVLLPSTLVLSFFLSEWQWPADLFQQMCKRNDKHRWGISTCRHQEYW